MPTIWIVFLETTPMLSTVDTHLYICMDYRTVKIVLFFTKLKWKLIILLSLPLLLLKYNNICINLGHPEFAETLVQRRVKTERLVLENGKVKVVEGDLKSSFQYSSI